MAVLNIYNKENLEFTSSNSQEIRNELDKFAINYQVWSCDKITADSSPEEIEANFKSEIQSVLEDNNFSSFDIVSISPNTENLETLKAKFVPEHIHEDNEVRFFIDGEGLFCIHNKDKVIQLLCQKGDYISVPAHTKHWFDMGSQANFKCIRFFENPEGWIAKYTGSDVSAQFPLLDKFKELNN